MYSISGQAEDMGSGGLFVVLGLMMYRYKPVNG
jgi:hypothetical protein